MAGKNGSAPDFICTHCRTRLDIVTPRDALDNETESSQSKRQRLESDVEPNSQICLICLDILNPEFVQSITGRILEILSKENYDTTSFSISTIVPFSVWIREYLTCLFNGSSYLFEDRKSSLKRLLRRTFSREIVSSSSLKYDPNSSLEIIVELRHAEADRQVSHLASLLFPLDEQRRRAKCHTSAAVTFATVERILSHDELAKFRELNAFPLSQVDAYCELQKVTFENAPLFIAGRYNKYSRNISQTPWMLDGEIKLDSVENIITISVDRIFSPSAVRFTSAGREDIDVKMLGTGRPFLLELINPRRSSNIKEKCRQVESELKSNEHVTVSLMTPAAKSHTSLIKQGEEMNKTYRALLFSKIEFTEGHIETIMNTKNLKLKQKTPVRVIHRRAPATRDKVVYSMSVERRDKWHLHLHLTTQSGTYIKEFVHGDLGRTQPNLRSLLALPDLDIMELDVLNVALEWPVNS